MINPATVPPVGVVCILAGDDGEGVLDCDGGEPGIDFTVSRDHNTSPGSPGNAGSTVGQADDPTCTSVEILADGTLSRACIEGTASCAGGMNVSMICTTDAECPDSTCAPCSTEPQTGHGLCRDGNSCQSGAQFGNLCTSPAECDGAGCSQSLWCQSGPNSGRVCFGPSDCADAPCVSCTQHPNAYPGVCNSPVEVMQSGTFAPGDAIVALPLALVILGSDAFTFGVDNLPCTADDRTGTCEGGTNNGRRCFSKEADCPDCPTGSTCGGGAISTCKKPPPAAVLVPLSTGTSKLSVFDADNTRRCQGSANESEICTTDPDCPGGVCSLRKIGPSSELACTSSLSCPPGETCVNSSTSQQCLAPPCACRTICQAGTPCVSEVDGKPLSCTDFLNGNFTGWTLGGGFVTLDTIAQDVTTIFRFTFE